ncbi:MAG: hypothetical protein JKY87_05410, partial [Mariprofundus sp.]|nr:hypothetical protein [Mariprofundus sp.]
MPTPDYRATPISTNKLPPGLAFIIGNEAAERFSFYGMRAILIVFMTQYLLNADGTMAMMSEDEAKGVCLSGISHALAWGFNCRWFAGQIPHHCIAFAGLLPRPSGLGICSWQLG